MWAQLLQGMWDLPGPTKDGTHLPCIARWILNHWTTREALDFAFFFVNGAWVSPAGSRAAHLFAGLAWQDHKITFLSGSCSLEGENTL